METRGPAHLVRIVRGRVQVGHPRACPRLVATDDEALPDGPTFQCGVARELEFTGEHGLIGLVEPGVEEFLVQFWSEEEDDSAWGPGAYRSGIRLLEPEEFQIVDHRG